MENRMVIEIAGNEIHVVSDQPPEVMRKTASSVQDRMLHLMGSGKMTSAVAAILTAMNITEELEKEEAASDQLRRELTAYAQENAEHEKQMDQLKEEKDKLARELENLKVDFQIRETAFRELKDKEAQLAEARDELASIREGHQRYRQENQRKLEKLENELKNAKGILESKQRDIGSLQKEQERLKSELNLKKAEADESEALKVQLQEWKNKWQSAEHDLEDCREKVAAAGALGEELSSLRKEYGQAKDKDSLAADELETLREKNEAREEAYQRERDELQRELAEYKMRCEELAQGETMDDGEDAAELLEYKSKYEELVEEFEAFKINYALKSNELERLKKQLKR